MKLKDSLTTKTTTIADVKITFTIFKSSSSPLTKVFKLNSVGEIVKRAAAQMYKGEAIKKEVGFNSFVDELNLADAYTAFGYGVSDSAIDERVQVVSKRQLANYENAISRSKEYFNYDECAGVLMLDYDPSVYGAKVESVESFIEIISAIFPQFSDCGFVSRSSVSAGVYKKDDVITTINKAFHAYCAAKNASDIPRFGKVLFKRLWLFGYGHIDISASGSQLVRTIIDGTVFSSERLDFVAKPIIEGEEILYLEPHVIQRQGGYLETELLTNLTSAEEVEYTRLVDAEKIKSSAIAIEIKNKWKSRKVQEMVDNGMKKSLAKKQINRLTKKSTRVVLPMDFVLHFSSLGAVKVSDVLKNMKNYDELALADPFEGPEYGLTTAKIWVTSDGKCMVINSMAHGQSSNYFLETVALKSGKKAKIKLVSGNKPEIVNQCEQVLLKSAHLYEFCNTIVSVVSAKNDPVYSMNSKKIIPAGAVHLTELIMMNAEIEKMNSKAMWVPANLPIDYASTLLSRKNWILPQLKGVIYSPTLREDGSILQTRGYDKASGLYFDSKINFPDIPQEPTYDDAIEALKLLKKPFETFDFEFASDLSTVISAICTSLVRKSVNNAPLFLVTSPKMGCGKGLVVNSIAKIATGSEASVMSQTSDENEERKRLMSALLAGDQIICIDNIEKNFQSETLCSVLTMATLTDRLLSKTQMVSASTQVTFLATGNNVSVVGDLTRRVLPITIDPQVEKPYERSFERHLPTYINEHRQELVVAALTILRAYHVAGRPKQNLTAFGSFETWSAWIRSAIVWVGLADPCLGLKRWEYIDPVRADVSTVFDSCYQALKTGPFTVSDLVGMANNVGNQDLYDALFSVSEKNGKINSRILGRWLVKYCNRIESGFRLEKAGQSGTRPKYRIKQVETQG